MSQPSRSRQLLLYGTAASLLLTVLMRYGVFGGGDQATVAVAHLSIPVAQQRLEILRRKAALVPGKEAVLKQVQAELAQREKGIVQESTAAQAQAHLMELLHRTALANGFDTQGAAQLPEPKALGKDYGQVSVGQNFTCGIDQLVNFLSAIANEPEILATDSVIVASAKNKNKDIQVRLIFAGVIPKNLVPEKKGVNTF
jgi:hypothetical protein